MSSAVVASRGPLADRRLAPRRDRGTDDHDKKRSARVRKGACRPLDYYLMYRQYGRRSAVALALVERLPYINKVDRARAQGARQPIQKSGQYYPDFWYRYMSDFILLFY